MMKALKEKLGHLYNKVSDRKESVVGYVRRRCDDIPTHKRFRIVATAFVLFALLSLFVLGKSIYNIYNGVHSNPDFGSIKVMPMPDKGVEPSATDLYGSEDDME